MGENEIICSHCGAVLMTDEGTWGRAIFVTFVIDTLTKIC